MSEQNDNIMWATVPERILFECQRLQLGYTVNHRDKTVEIMCVSVARVRIFSRIRGQSEDIMSVPSHVLDHSENIM